MMDDIDRDVCHEIYNEVVSAMAKGGKYKVEKVRFTDPGYVATIRSFNEHERWFARVEIKWGRDLNKPKQTNKDLARELRNFINASKENEGFDTGEAMEMLERTYSHLCS